MNKAIISDLHQIFKSCAVMPQNLIKKSLKYNLTTQLLNIDGKDYNLKNKDVSVVGMGKAVQYMANEIENILSTKIKQGIISIPIGSYIGMLPSKIAYYEGAKNNLPDTNALVTAKKIKHLTSNLNENDVLIVLISGGGSALLPLPRGSIKLEEKSLLIKSLANAGADIIEMNTVRKRISEIKGGRLAILAQPATVIALILSDIVGDPIDLIASGPTYENKDESTAALRIVKKYNLYDTLPYSIKTTLTTKENIPDFPINNVHNVIIGSNKLSIAAGISEATALNYFPIEISNVVSGNVKHIAHEYVKLVKLIIKSKDGLITDELESEFKSLNIPAINSNLINNIIKFQNKDLCLILGGETTIEVRGLGKGGRNQQLALEFSKLINKYKTEAHNYNIYFLSAGTDGIDGPTDVAGAIGYLNLISDAEKVNINVDDYLINNDTYNFYKKFKNGTLHVVTGHTNTNVMDIHLIIIKKCT